MTATERAAFMKPKIEELIALELEKTDNNTTTDDFKKALKMVIEAKSVAQKLSQLDMNFDHLYSTLDNNQPTSQPISMLRNSFFQIAYDALQFCAMCDMTVVSEN